MNSVNSARNRFLHGFFFFFLKMETFRELWNMIFYLSHPRNSWRMTAFLLLLLIPLWNYTELKCYRMKLEQVVLQCLSSWAKSCWQFFSQTLSHPLIINQQQQKNECFSTGWALKHVMQDDIKIVLRNSSCSTKEKRLNQLREWETKKSIE